MDAVADGRGGEGRPLSDIERELWELRERCAALERDNARLLEERGCLTDTLSEISNSRWWRMTAPLRNFGKPRREAERALTEVPRLQPLVARGDEAFPPLRPCKVSVSFVIPVLNGAADLEKLLPALAAQEQLGKTEILVVDSGSADGSAGLVRRQGARVIEIAPEQFSHSFARNLGAEEATGEIVVFLTQDALPVGHRWARRLIEPIAAKKAVAATGMQVPRDGADLFETLALWVHARFVEFQDGGRIARWPDDPSPEAIDRNAHLDDVNCAIRRDVLLRHRYRGGIIEDFDLGVRLLRDGHAIAFLSSAQVLHSHDRPAFYTFRRNFAVFRQKNIFYPEWTPAPLSRGAALSDIWNALLQMQGIRRALRATGGDLTAAQIDGLLRPECIALPEGRGFDPALLRDNPCGDGEIDAFLARLFALPFAYERGRTESAEAIARQVELNLLPYLLACAGDLPGLPAQVADSALKYFALAAGRALADYLAASPGDADIAALCGGLTAGV